MSLLLTLHGCLNDRMAQYLAFYLRKSTGLSPILLLIICAPFRFKMHLFGFKLEPFRTPKVQNKQTLPGFRLP